MSRERHRPKKSFAYVFLAPEGSLNTWELRFGSDGPYVIRGQSNYFDQYLTLVRLARKYPIRYIFCTTALEELERIPRSLRPYVIPGAMPFSSLDIFGVAAVRQRTLEDRVKHYARSRYLRQWLLIDSTYERRDICTPEYVSLACDPVEGLGNTKLLKRITQWLDCTQEPVTFLGSGLAGVSDRFLRFSQNFQYTYHNQ